jgi:hypothetical protein
MNDISLEKRSFFATGRGVTIALMVILILGLAIRLYDLTDLPLDFHPTRQLLSALKARGMYYQTLENVPEESRDFAVQQWKIRAAIEPEVLEQMVAFTYRFTGEHLWIARIYSSIFWVIGGFFLFLLARQIISVDGALAAAALYLFISYAVTASRSFQPDPLMVMLIIIFWWAVVRWSNDPSSYKFAIIAGLSGGLAIFIKFVAAFFIIGGGLGAILRRGSIPEAIRRPQVHVMVVLGILPGALYVVYGVWLAGYLGQQFGGRFIPSLFLSPAYYLGWVGMVNLVIGGAALMMALLGLLFLRRENLRFMLGLWIAYVLFGLYFNYHISSHDYYSLPLIPIVALSFGALAGDLFSRLAASGTSKTFVTGILCMGLFTSLWQLRADMKSVDYRSEALKWVEIGEVTGDNNLAGLTQDYGSRLAYWGWKNLTSWPTSGDLNYHVDMRGAQDDFEKQFEELTRKKDLFIVTDFDELERQPFLQEKLLDIPLFAEGDGYLIYDIGDSMTE